MKNKTTTKIKYGLPGDAHYQAKLYPPVNVINSDLGLNSPEKVIKHFTLSSLNTDYIAIEKDSLKVTADNGKYFIEFDCDENNEAKGQAFAKMHQLFMNESHAGQAIKGVEFCKATPGAWNPMAGFPVNGNKSDGKSKWEMYLPLGMPISRQKSVTLLHYPPYVAMQTADYLENMTLNRWQQVLECVGINESEIDLYKACLDVNPIAAPGSGESEYENDYFPVMLSSVFFDNEEKSNYIRNMLQLQLNPEHNKDNPYTLPLLICGSALYDPQAPAWFRVRFKDQLPVNKDGVPQVNILQAGSIKLFEHSEKETPYMIANHMIAAGVTGKCTNDPATIPDIRKYEAQDLVAATFLKLFGDNPDITPEQAKEQACKRWFNNETAEGAPDPQTPEDQLTICALAQMDLFFDSKNIKPVYTWEQAKERCNSADNGDNPCKCSIAP